MRIPDVDLPATNVQIPPIQRDGFRQTRNRMFGRGIGCGALARGLRRNRTVVYDPPTVCGHMAKRLAGAQEHSR